MRKQHTEISGSHFSASKRAKTQGCGEGLGGPHCGAAGKTPISERRSAVYLLDVRVMNSKFQGTSVEETAPRFLCVPEYVLSTEARQSPHKPGL